MALVGRVEIATPIRVMTAAAYWSEAVRSG